MMWEFYGLDGTKKLCQCTSSIINLKEGNKVVVESQEKIENTKEELILFRYNKSTVKAQRLYVKIKITKNIN